MFYNNYYNLSTIVFLTLIYVLLNQINNKNIIKKEEIKEIKKNKEEIKLETNIEKEYDFICISFENKDIEDILKVLVDKYFMSGILIGRFNFIKRDYCKYIEIEKKDVNENELLNNYLKSRFIMKLDKKNIIENINIPILNLQNIDKIEEKLLDIINNYDKLKTK